MGRRVWFGGLISVLVLIWLVPPAGAAEERILDFNSSIIIRPDSSLEVTERIRVVAQGREIRRGIIREFPTRYKNRQGKTVRVGFALKKVLRDGKPEPYHTKTLSNGIAIYIGSKDVFLKQGEYTYTLVYETDRQLGYFEGYDELYWNVTGNGWSFAIERAEARITLPPGAEILKYSGYTGPQGAKGKNYTVRTGSGQIVFATTKPLAPEEGLTVAVSWPKGLVVQPDPLDYAFRDYKAPLIGLFGLLVVLIYYLVIWFRVGKDPEKGTIIPLFEPPTGLSPAAVRVVSMMGYDKKVATVAVVDMAVKKYLTIQDEDGEYTLHRTGQIAAGLFPGEKKLARHFFSGTDKLRLKKKNHLRISKGIGALKEGLRNEYGKSYFLTNRGYFIIGLALSLLTIGAMVLISPDLAQGGFISIWLTAWTFGCTMLTLIAFGAWRRVFSGGFSTGGLTGAIFFTLFTLPFLVGEVVGLVILSAVISFLGILVGVILAIINVAFFKLLKAPTRAGRKVMDKIEGFKKFLVVAEKDRINMLNPPEETPELFEKYLPYAMALDVEVEWGERFEGVLARAAAGESAYSPLWYTGRSWSLDRIGGFTSSLGSGFSGAISSASTAPGSSSGSGGGGSSGGGGGGGGGSGW